MQELIPITFKFVAGDRKKIHSITLLQNCRSQNWMMVVCCLWLSLFWSSVTTL